MLRIKFKGVPVVLGALEAETSKVEVWLQPQISLCRVDTS